MAYNRARSMPSALRRQIGQLLFAGFRGQTLPIELIALAREFQLGGVILFARNISEPEQIVEHPLARLRDVELKPFRAAIAAEIATIMTAHLFMPALDEERPATLSRRIVTDLLREELEFPGVILSDDLEMKAITRSYTVPS